MGEIISYQEKKIIAKGLNPKNKINLTKLKTYFFKEDYKNLKLLNSIKIPFQKEELTLLYPGCGADIFFPLVYLEKLFPKVNRANFTFVDLEDNLGIIKTILDEVGINFEEKDNQIKFYWKRKVIHLQFLTQNIEDYLNQPKPIDLYFERAFRIMREQIPEYETKIINLLLPDGILISDAGFEDANLSKIEVPQELSAYREMIMGIKKI